MMIRLLSGLFILYFTAVSQTAYNGKTIVRSYFFSASGNDKNDGTKQHPYKTIAFLNSLVLHAGDSVFFKGRDTFPGNIIIQSSRQSSDTHPIILTSYGDGTAVINAGNKAAITINESSFINIKNINCTGAGRKNGNTTNGISINQSRQIIINDAELSGFQKAGLLVYNSFNIDVENVYAHDNGFAGISISGLNKKDDCGNIHIDHCRAENNPGDPTNFGNHSGNGIIAGFCKQVLIENCTATNNGWDMPRTGNGPVGIWCYEADSVTIQYCFSFKNKTSHGGEDGGGYDFDGGTTNSVIQYCVSYENQGSAFGIFQYAGASPWHDNTVRFCTSENDGNVSAAHANVYVWNSSHDASQFRNFTFTHNLVYNNENAAISYASENLRSNFQFVNNNLTAKDTIIHGSTGNDIFLNNNCFSLKPAASMQPADALQ